MPLFEAFVTVARPADAVFEFLIRPGRVVETLPDDAGVTYVNVPETLELGARLEFDLQIIGPAHRCIQEVTEFVRPARFVESQIEGPLPVWRHEHVLEADGAATRVVDRIEFAPPAGLAGFLVTEERIRQSLEKGFAHRHRRLKEILEAGG